MINVAEHKERFARLQQIQNHPKNRNVDIMTMAGFCENWMELIVYIREQEKRIK